MNKMIKLTFLAIFAVLGAARRNDTSSIEDFHQIDAAANNLASVIKAWDGTGSAFNDVDSSFNVLINLFDSANYDAAEAGDSSSENSIAIIDYITKTAEPDIAAALDALVLRAADFKSAGAEVYSDVQSALQDLKSKTDAFATTLLVTTYPDQQDAARVTTTKFDSDYSKAIAAFP